jgi:hypothetical protein
LEFNDSLLLLFLAPLTVTLSSLGSIQEDKTGGAIMHERKDEHKIKVNNKMYFCIKNKITPLLNEYKF